MQIYFNIFIDVMILINVRNDCYQFIGFYFILGNYLKFFLITLISISSLEPFINLFKFLEVFFNDISETIENAIL